MRLKPRHKQRKFLMFFPVLLIFAFGLLFIPSIQNALPHTLVENAFNVSYKSQYDNSGTKAIDESTFSHSAPTGDWQPSKYRVELSQVTTWDDHTLADQNDDYGSHIFEGSALTNEETYYVEFDFGSLTTPGITRTADPTDTADLTLGQETDDSAVTFDGVFIGLKDTNEKLEMLNGELITQTSENSEECIGSGGSPLPHATKFKALGTTVTTVGVKIRNDDNTARTFYWQLRATWGGANLDSGSFSVAGYYNNWKDVSVNHSGLNVNSWYYFRLSCEDERGFWKKRDTDVHADLIFVDSDGTDKTQDFTCTFDFTNTIGNYISTTIDGGDPNIFTSMNINSTLAGATVTLYCDSDADDVGWAYSWTQVAVLSGGVENGLTTGVVDEPHQYLRYKVDVSLNGAAGTWIDDIDVNYGTLSETFDASELDDPTGCEMNSVQMDISLGAAGYNLTNTDLTLTDDWAGWSVSGATGNGNSGSWTLSGAWLDVDGTFTVEFIDAVSDADGFTINYSNTNVGCSLSQMGLDLNNATATVDNFDIDGQVTTYNNDGGTIVLEVGLDTTDGMDGSKTIVWKEDNYSGALTDWLFTYDLNYKVRDYVSCNDAGITINAETPTYTAIGGGAVIVLQNDLDSSIEFDETGDEIPSDDINNCIFTVTVEGDYEINHRPNITADDDDIGKFEARFTRTVTPHSTPTLQSNPVRFRFGSDYGDFGDIGIAMKQPGGEMTHLAYLTEFTIGDGSTIIEIKRGVFSGADWQSGEYEFWIRFNADEDAYYELTNTEAEDLIGLTVTEWEKYTDVLVREEQNQYIMKGLIENVDVREEFCFSVGQEIPNKYKGHIDNAEIWRYETGQSGEEIFTNIYALTPNEAKTKWWGNYHISPKYDDFLMLYIDTPTMIVEKVRAENTEYDSFKQLNIGVTSYEALVENVYMDIDLGEQNILPQRYDFLIVEWTGEGITEVIEGRVRDYHLYWQRDNMNVAEYHYIIFLREKTTTEKFQYLWMQLTQQEIITGGVTISAVGEEAWEYPTIEIPSPEIQIPEFEIPRIRADISPINWSAIGERLIYYGRFASGYSSLIGALTVTISLVIIVNQLNVMNKMNQKQKQAVV